MTDLHAVEFRSISKSFPMQGRALDAVSFCVRPGEMVALIGHSGSGKSTLLRSIAGLVETDKEDSHIKVLNDTVQNHGRISPSIKKTRRRIGFIFQQYNLVGRLPLIINVLAGLLGNISSIRAACGIFLPSEFARAKECLSHVGLMPQAWQRTDTLSGGQQQRGAIARALLQDAQLVLADEPIASLDPLSAEAVMSLLRKLKRERNITVLVSLHQIDFALRYCDRAIVLQKGKILYDGPTAGLPASTIEAFYKDEHNPLQPSLEKTA